MDLVSLLFRGDTLLAVLTVSTLTVLVVNTLYKTFGLHPLVPALVLSIILSMILVPAVSGSFFSSVFLYIVCGISAFGVATGAATFGGRIIFPQKSDSPLGGNREYSEPASIRPPPQSRAGAQSRKPSFSSGNLAGETIHVGGAKTTRASIPPRAERAGLPAPIAQPHLGMPNGAKSAKATRRFWHPWV